MIKLFVFVGLVVLSSSVFGACNNDYDCGYGNKCVKAERTYGGGICVKPKNNSYNFLPKNKPHEVKGCSFDLDCGIGNSCVKRGNQLYGICVK